MTLTKCDGEPDDDDGLPMVSVHLLLDTARECLALGHVSGTMGVLAQAHGILQRYVNPDGERSGGLDQVLSFTGCASASRGVSSLTTAELRLVPYMATHLTFPEIGERLYLSAHTVKTQAISIYRKLGVSSRGEAVSFLQDLGVLRPDSTGRV